MTNFYSHAPRGARHDGKCAVHGKGDISTHTPLAGRDGATRNSNVDVKFLLTRPSRGATQEKFSGTFLIQFLLTRPSRGATRYRACSCSSDCISTHTPLAGRDGYTFESAYLVKISTHTPLAGRDFDTRY